MRGCCCPCGGAGIASAATVSRGNLSFWFSGPALPPSSVTHRPHAGFLPLLRCQSGGCAAAAVEPISTSSSVSTLPSTSATPFSASATLASTPAAPSPPPVHPFVVSTGIQTCETSVLSPVTISIPVGDREVIIETGLIGRQANGAVTISDGETILYTTACAAIDPSDPSDFVPLTIQYQERLSAAGRTSGGFIKREGRARDNEILVCRLIDRPIRPLVMKGFNYETQVLVWVLSYDTVHTPEPLAITAAGAALAISDIPIQRPVAGVRVGFIDGAYVVNPTVQQLSSSKLDMVIAGTSEAVLMIEGYCDFLTEAQLLKAVEVGQKAVSEICRRLEDFAAEVGRRKNLSAISLPPIVIGSYIEDLFGDQLSVALQIKSKRDRGVAIGLVEQSVLVALTEEGVRKDQVTLKDEERDENWDQVEEEEDAVVEDGEVDEGDVHVKPVLRKPVTELFDPADVKRVFKDISSKIMRKLIVQKGIRSDGRGVADVRPIQSLCGLLPRAHGSALFTRGETQALAVVTLGGTNMGQRLDNLNNIEDVKHFYLQYTFPPSCVGETGRIGAPSRREIGHGTLAERALEPALPSESEFPYTIRVESTITESNGSSSMASVCGGCLAMLDAGVPLKSPIAGVAMGLVLNTKDCGGDGEPVILTDILGSEDALGDMDFKVAGNEHGITAFQMDIKVEGITLAILEKALAEAKKGRCAILAEMTKSSPPPARSLSKYAPLIARMKVPTDKLNLVIGPGGKTVKGLIEETGVDSIDIEDDGTISILSRLNSALEVAKARIAGITMVPVVGQIYRNCRVKSVVTFGCFVEIAPSREALLHISELDTKRVAKVEDVANPGDVLDVKLIEINARGQLRVSRRALLGPVQTQGLAGTRVNQIEKGGEQALGEASEKGKQSEQSSRIWQVQGESAPNDKPGRQNSVQQTHGAATEDEKQGEQKSEVQLVHGEASEGEEQSDLYVLEEPEGEEGKRVKQLVQNTGAQGDGVRKGRQNEQSSAGGHKQGEGAKRGRVSDLQRTLGQAETAKNVGSIDLNSGRKVAQREVARRGKQCDPIVGAEGKKGIDSDLESAAVEVPKKVRRTVRKSTGDVSRRVKTDDTLSTTGLEVGVEKASSSSKKLANSMKEI